MCASLVYALLQMISSSLKTQAIGFIVTAPPPPQTPDKCPLNLWIRERGQVEVCVDKLCNRTQGPVYCSPFLLWNSSL